MRIGPQMSRAVAIVTANPGCNKFYVGSRLHVACRSRKNCAIGYEPVNRAIRAGLICAEYIRGHYSLSVPPPTDEPA